MVSTWTYFVSDRTGSVKNAERDIERAAEMIKDFIEIKYLERFNLKRLNKKYNAQTSTIGVNVKAMGLCDSKRKENESDRPIMCLN